MTDRWNAEHASYTSAQQHTSDIGGTFSGASKAFRYMLQSAALGAGAYLTIIGDIHLDTDGDKALAEAIAGVRSRGEPHVSSRAPCQ